jgi:hypothetical protein
MEGPKRATRRRKLITKISEESPSVDESPLEPPSIEESVVQTLSQTPKTRKKIIRRTIPSPSEISEEIPEVSKKYFDVTDQVMYAKSQELPYVSDSSIKKYGIKWGQRKLIVSIMQFFTLYWDSEKYENPICVYVGAAPGVFVNVMTVLFPAITWQLYDTADFNRALPIQDNVTIYDRYFTDEDTKELRKLGKKGEGIFFVSDIRNLGYSDKDKNESEKYAMTDMLMQQKWVIDINPVAAQLKFRLPYVNVADDKSKFPYLQGVPYFQSWAPGTSSETRMVPKRNDKDEYYLVNWDPKRYEDMCSYHNKVTRSPGTKYINPITGTNELLDAPELLDDWDSTNEAIVISQYLEKIGQDRSKENVAIISRFITSEINRAYDSDYTIAKKRFEQIGV